MYNGPYSKLLHEIMGLLAADNGFGGPLTTVKLELGNPKNPVAALRKIDGTRDNYKPVSSLVDVTRASFVSSAGEYFNMIQKLGAIIEAKEVFDVASKGVMNPLKEFSIGFPAYIQLLRFKNRACGRSSTDGYVDMMLNLRVGGRPPCEAENKLNPHVVELQLHYDEMLAAKNGDKNGERSVVEVMVDFFKDAGVNEETFPREFSGHSLYDIVRIIQNLMKATQSMSVRFSFIRSQCNFV